MDELVVETHGLNKRCGGATRREGGRKVIITDIDHYSPFHSDALWAWKPFLRGHNPILYDLGIVNGANPTDPSAGARPVSRWNRPATRWATPSASPPGSTSASRGDLTSTGYALASSQGTELLVLQPEASEGRSQRGLGADAVHARHPGGRHVPGTAPPPSFAEQIRSGAHNAPLDAFLTKANDAVRQVFKGSVTYASVPLETVDWGRFDLVGVDLYRGARIRDRFTDLPRRFFTHDRPSSSASSAAAPTGEPPTSSHSDDPKYDLDMASYSLVTSYGNRLGELAAAFPDLPWDTSRWGRTYPDMSWGTETVVPGGRGLLCRAGTACMTAARASIAGSPAPRQPARSALGEGSGRTHARR